MNCGFIFTLLNFGPATAGSAGPVPTSMCFVSRHTFSPTAEALTLVSWKLTFIPHSFLRYRIGDDLWFIHYGVSASECIASRDTSYTILCLDCYPTCSKSNCSDNTDQVTQLNQQLRHLCPSMLMV